LVSNLMKINTRAKANRKFSYIVKKAVVVSASPLKDDAAKLQQIAATYRAAHGDLSGISRIPAGGGVGPMGGSMPPFMGGPGMGPGGMPTGMPPGMMGGMPPGMMGGMPPGAMGGMPPGMMAAMGATGQNASNAAASKCLDAVTGEDVTKDWEFVVLFAVVLDPPASMLPAPANPGPATNPPGVGGK
jgi:hypothetical protein